tara:strand:+ start:953 stop:1813 length:861 start_codon:yes stop_codon:yes gene_type:complete
MASITMTSSSTTNPLTTSIRQNTSKQDFVKSGKATDENGMDYDFIVLADGHGSLSFNRDIIINFIRNYDWDKQLKFKNWYEGFTLASQDVVSKSTGAGATLSVVRIYRDRYECWWIGDSSIRIYQNCEEIWRSLDHDANNLAEHKRLKKINQGYWFKLEQKPMVLTPNTITVVPSYRAILAPRDKIAMTRSLGHRNRTGNEIEFASIPREENESYKLVMGSDGLWDMVCDTDTTLLSSKETTAEKIMDWVYDRWQQEWTFIDKKQKHKTTFPDWNRDDICIGVFIG